MQFNNDEIIFLTSVTQGNKPFGISYRMPPEGKKAEVVARTLETLKKKAILDEEGKLTKEGAAVLRLWELYRNSSRHITVNQTKAAVMDKGKLITVCQQGEIYEVNATDSITLMQCLLRECPYLCQADEQPARGKWKGMSEEEWEQEMETIEDGIPIAEYDHGKLSGRKVFYWKENQGYLCNVERLRVRSLTPQVMRKQIFQILGGEGYE